MAAIFNIPDQYNGDSFEEVTFNFFINDTNTVNDLSGSTPRLQIKNKKDLSTAVETLTIGSGLEWVDTDTQDGDSGILKISMTDAIDWGAGTFVYDLQITTTNPTKVKTYVKGEIKVLSEITT